MVIDLDEEVSKGLAFMVERVGRQAEIQTLFIEIFSLGQSLLRSEVLFVLLCRCLSCENWHETDQLFHTSQQSTIISK